MLLSSICSEGRARSADELVNLCRIFDPLIALDAAADIDAKGMHSVNCRSHICGVEPAGKNQLAATRELRRQLPVGCLTGSTQWPFEQHSSWQFRGQGI